MQHIISQAANFDTYSVPLSDLTFISDRMSAAYTYHAGLLSARHMMRDAIRESESTVLRTLNSMDRGSESAAAAPATTWSVQLQHTRLCRRENAQVPVDEKQTQTQYQFRIPICPISRDAKHLGLHSPQCVHQPTSTSNTKPAPEHQVLRVDVPLGCLIIFDRRIHDFRWGEYRSPSLWIECDICS